MSRHQADQGKRCNAESVNYELCVQSQRVCDSNGRTDGSATYSRINSNCQSAANAVTCCVIGFGCTR